MSAIKPQSVKSQRRERGQVGRSAAVKRELGAVNARDPRYLAVSARDRRFDGLFYTAVTSTGIYCRPICPARTPKPENVRFYPTRAAAEAAGFRACLRCRPYLAPELESGSEAEPDERAALSTRRDSSGGSVLGERTLADEALKLITAGALDGADGPTAVESLAQSLHISSRHLRRVMAVEVGAGPLAVARTRRIQTARTLLETTEMPVTDVAFAAGFGSVRQFNDTFRAAFGRTPTRFRSDATATTAPAVDADAGDGYATAGTGALTLRSGHRGQVDLRHLVSWFSGRAVDGVEEVTGPASYRRTVRLPGGYAVIGFGPGSSYGTHDSYGAGAGIGTAVADAVRGYITLAIDPDLIHDLGAGIELCRGLLDLDADIEAIDGVLAADSALAPLVSLRPGLRIPGVVDGFEMAVRAVLGQQVSVAAARTFATRLVARHGDVYAAHGTLTRLFPTAGQLVDADLDGLGLTGSRIRSIRALAEAVASGGLALDRRGDRAATRAGLLALPGIGPWTVDYLAMRALGDPDAFPIGDLVLRQSAVRLGLPQGEKQLLAYAERWRPWRAYAAIHLWADQNAHNVATAGVKPRAAKVVKTAGAKDA
jgi:AraC family transcriptional regulator of adaptative response / DNA-3-methyladenine glycosylase II